MTGNNMNNFKSPKDFCMAMLQQNMGNNPILANVFEKMQSGNYGDIEKIARNLCAQKGINPDQAIKEIQNRFKS